MQRKNLYTFRMGQGKQSLKMGGDIWLLFFILLASLHFIVRYYVLTDVYYLRGGRLGFLHFFVWWPAQITRTIFTASEGVGFRDFGSSVYSLSFIFSYIWPLTFGYIFIRRKQARLRKD